MTRSHRGHGSVQRRPSGAFRGPGSPHSHTQTHAGALAGVAAGRWPRVRAAARVRAAGDVVVVAAAALQELERGGFGGRAGEGRTELAQNSASTAEP